MALVIDASVGGSASNSFVLLSEATTYMESRLNGSLWTAASTDDQNRALAEATREISNKTFEGSRASSTQALSWPRQWACDPDSPNGWYYDAAVIPQRIKDATMELAFQFINAGTSDLAVADPNAGLIGKTVDVLSWQWSEYKRPTGLARFTRVMDYLRPLLSGSGSSVPLIRG